MRTPGDIVRGTNKNALRPVPPQRSNWKIHQRADTSKLSRLGEVIEVSGEGCEGCVSLRGSFRVEAVLKDDIRRPLLEPLMVICEGTMDVSRSCQCPACPETWQELPGLRPQGLLFRSDLVSSSTAAVYGEHGAPH
jgi:hypothetical protein